MRRGATIGIVCGLLIAAAVAIHSLWGARMGGPDESGLRPSDSAPPPAPLAPALAGHRADEKVAKAEPEVSRAADGGAASAAPDSKADGLVVHVTADGKPLSGATVRVRLRKAADLRP